MHSAAAKRTVQTTPSIGTGTASSTSPPRTAERRTIAAPPHPGHANRLRELQQAGPLGQLHRAAATRSDPLPDRWRVQVRPMLAWALRVLQEQWSRARAAPQGL